METEYNSTMSILEKLKIDLKNLDREKMDLMEIERNQKTQIKMLEIDLEKKDKESIEKNENISFMKKALEKQDLNIEELKM